MYAVSPAHPGAHAIAVGVTIAALAGAVPPIAACLGAAFYAISIFESIMRIRKDWKNGRDDSPPK